MIFDLHVDERMELILLVSEETARLRARITAMRLQISQQEYVSEADRTHMLFLEDRILRLGGLKAKLVAASGSDED